MTTIDKTIADSAHDAGEAGNGTVNIVASPTNVVDATNEWNGLYWDISDAPIPAGATIDVCAVTVHMPTAGMDEPNHTVRFEELAAPGIFVAGTATFTISGRAMTAASVTLGDGTTQSAPVNLATPDMSAVLQEVVDSQGELTAIVCIIQGGADGNDDLVIATFDGAANMATIHIEYTAAGGAGDVMARGYLKPMGIFS